MEHFWWWLFRVDPARPFVGGGSEKGGPSARLLSLVPVDLLVSTTGDCFQTTIRVFFTENVVRFVFSERKEREKS
jgi:hypothetical protein